MDNVTHAAIGMGVYATYVAVTGAPLGGPIAVCACVAAVCGAESPDIDILFSFRGPVQYLYHHRQGSHSLPMWFLYTLLTASILSLFCPGHFGLFALLAFIGVLTHVGTDMLTTYGTKALWPFSKKRWRGDSLFVVEPFFILLFLVGFFLFENNAPFRPLVYILDAIAIAYTGWRVILHAWLGRQGKRQMFKMFDEGDKPIQNQVTWRVTPTLFPVPHGYKFVAQRGNRFWFGSFSWVGQLKIEATKETDESGPVLFALRHTKVGLALWWFSPMLFATTETEGPCTVVRLADASVRYSNCLSFSGVVDVVSAPSGTYSVVNEGLRAQPIHIQKLWKDSFTRVGCRIRLVIPSPRGYRSNRKV